MLVRFLIQLDRHRRFVLLLVALALVASAYFIGRLQVLDSPERWMPRTTLGAWQEFERHFAAGDNVGIGLHFKRPVRDDDLPRLARLRRQLSAIQGMSRVYDASLVAERIEHVPLTELIDPAHDANYQLYSGVLWDRPTPGDPSRTLMTVCELVYRPEEDNHDPESLNARRRHVVAAVDRIVQGERERPDWGPNVDFHVASGIMMMGEMEKRTRQLAWTFLPASILVGLFSLLLGFRSLSALFVAVAGAAIAIVLVLGFLGAGGGTLGLVTIAAPSLISVIAVASTIHFAAFAAVRGSTGLRRLRPRLVRWVGVPCLGAAATTGVGFLMLAFNELAPVRDLGVQMFVGSLLAFLGVFVVSQWIPIRDAHAGALLTPARCQRMGKRICRRPALVVASTAALVAGLLFCAWPREKDSGIGLRIDADPFSFFGDDQPIKKALNHFSKKKFAVYQLDTVLVPRRRGAAVQGLNPPDRQYQQNLAAAKQFAAVVSRRNDLGVLRVLSTMAFRERYDAFLAEMYQTLRDRGALAAFLQFGGDATSANVFNNSFQSWNVDKLNSGALRVTFVAHDSDEGFDALMQCVRNALPRDRFDCYLVGSIAQNIDLTEGMSRGMVYGLGSSLLVMGLLCGFLFRSWRLAAIAFVPNLFPVLVVFGLMGATDTPISSGSAMVATIALGIALNDTIHFLLHYRQQTRVARIPIRDAVVHTTGWLGRPIIVTSLVHAAGFTIFLATDFLPLYHFGLFSAVAMLAALVGDLILLPNLLLVFDKPPAAKVA